MEIATSRLALDRSLRGLKRPSAIALVVAMAILLLPAVLAAQAGAVAPRADFFGMTSIGRLATGPEAEEISRLGVHNHRLPIELGKTQASRWAPCDGEQTSPVNFTYYDGVFTRAANNNITAIVDLGRCASQQFPKLGSNDPVYGEAKYKALTASTGFFAQTVKRYGYNGTFWSDYPSVPYHPVRVWEVWNEPNLPENNPGGAVDPQAYAKFLIDSAKAIRQAQEAQSGMSVEATGTKVLMGGLFSEAMSVSSYFNSIYSSPKNYTASEFHSAFDGLSYHPYAVAGTPANAEQYVKDARAALDQSRSALGGGSDSGKTLWLTEIGWPVGTYATEKGKPTKTITEANQATYLTQALSWIYANADANLIKYTAWYVYEDGVPCSKWACWPENAGLKRGEDEGGQGEYRPAWFAFQQQTGVQSWSPSTVAFQANTGTLFTWRSAGGAVDRKLAIAPGTSPSVAGLTPGGFWGRGNVTVFNDKATGSLWAWTPTGGSANLLLGMAKGTNPSVAALNNGNYVAAIQANTGSLHTWSTTETGRDRLLGMASGTSPSVAAGPSGSYVVALQANTGNLFTWTQSEGGLNRGFGMAAGTSPSAGVLPNGEMVIAFQTNTGVLWTWTPKGGAVNTLLGMAPGTSPSIAVLANGSYAVAIQANTGNLLTWTPSGGAVNTLLGMAKGTSPSISALPLEGYIAAIQANTGDLFTWSTKEGGVNRYLGMAPGTNPAIESGATPFPSPITE